MMFRLPNHIIVVITKMTRYLSQVRYGGRLKRQPIKTMGMIKLKNGMPIIISKPSLKPILSLNRFIGLKVQKATC